MNLAKTISSTMPPSVNKQLTEFFEELLIKSIKKADTFRRLTRREQDEELNRMARRMTVSRIMANYRQDEK